MQVAGNALDHRPSGEAAGNTVRCHLTLARMAVIRKPKTREHWRGGAKVSWYAAGGGAKWHSCYGKQYGDWSKKKTNLKMDPPPPLRS